MKIRLGFVSNSSTSSFCIIGRIVAAGTDIADFDLERIEHIPMILAGHLDGGRDVFKATKGHLDVIRKLKKGEAENFLLVDAVFVDYDGFEKAVSGSAFKHESGYTVFYGDADQNDGSDPERFEENIQYYE